MSAFKIIISGADVKDHACGCNIFESADTSQKWSIFCLKGKMKGLAFIKDPDGYWIEILNPNNMTKICH